MKYLYVDTLLAEEHGMSQSGSVGRKPPSKELRRRNCSGEVKPPLLEPRRLWFPSGWHMGRQEPLKPVCSEETVSRQELSRCPREQDRKETGPEQEFLGLK